MECKRAVSPTIHQAIEAMAVNCAAETFCHFRSNGHYEDITFLQLHENSLRYRRRYRSSGLQRGDVVVIMLRHSPNLFYSYLGAILAGAVPTFMPFPNPRQDAARFWLDHRALFERLKPRIVVSDDERSANIFSLWGVEVLLTSHFEDGGFSCGANDDMPYPDGGSVACLQHSSGTTALKKGVALSHRSIIGQVDAYSDAIGLTSDDVIASWLPFYHDMGFIACFMTALLTGVKLVALDAFEWVIKPHLLLDDIERYRATLCWLPNFAFSHIANMAPRTAKWDLTSMRAFINCSEPCKPHTFERFTERFAASGVTAEMLQVCYAMAENVFAVTQTEIGRQPSVIEADEHSFGRGTVVPAVDHNSGVRLLSCGKPVNGVRVRIIDVDGTEISDGNIGEITVQSPFLFSGYYALPEKTAEKLHDGWYRTGDLGFILNGELYVTGRADDLLLLNGRNYYAHEIEDIVNGIEGVVPGRAVAFTIEDPRTDAAGLVLLAECSDECSAAEVGRRVRSTLSDRLGLALYAFEAVPRASLVKSTSGKISRAKNKELYLSRNL